MTSSANSAAASAESSPIAGSVLPIERAQELVGTLPGVISARIIANSHGEVSEIHILTTTEVTPKQTVRNVESALMAHLGMRVSHKKISVATSDVSSRASRTTPPASPALQPTSPAPSAIALVPSEPPAVPSSTIASITSATPVVSITSAALPQKQPTEQRVDAAAHTPPGHRRLYFEDIEVRRSRSKGIACRVTLRKGDETFVGEMEGMDNDRLRIELAARAALVAIKQAVGDNRALALEGCRVIDAFDRQFVFAGVTAREGREHTLMTGSAEVRDSAETASVLAVLGATNRWLER